MKKLKLKPYFSVIGHAAHNPYYKLAEIKKYNGSSYLDLVYGISNEGENEGLEIYFKTEPNGHFYSSRRYLSNEIPKVYLKDFEYLKEFNNVVGINPGFKVFLKTP